MTDTTTKFIFKSDQKESDGIRKRLIRYFNTPGKFFSNHRGHSFWVEEIHELYFSNITGMGCYFMDCLVIRDGKKDKETYSIDPKVMIPFFRNEKLRKLKSKI